MSNRVIGHPNNERIATGYRKRYRGHTAGLGWSPMGFIRPLNPPQTARGPLPPPRRSKRWRYVPSPPFFFGSGWHLVFAERRLPRRALRCRLRDPPRTNCYSKDLGSFAFDPQKNADRYFCYRHRSDQKKSDVREKERSASLSEGK